MAIGAWVASSGLLAPLGGPQFGPGGLSIVLEAMLGSALIGAAVLSLLVAPVLLASRWVVGSRVLIPLGCWAAIGSLVALAPVVALNQPGGSLFAKIGITLDGIRSADGFAAWFPYVLGGGLLGWNLFKTREPADKRMEPTRH